MIGIFGGTFDPIHFGHLRAALEAQEIFGLDEVRLIPSAQPPHRPPPLAATRMRLEMLRLAVGNQPGFIVDTREIDRNGISYMVDTLATLHSDFPDQPLLLFIGSDAFNKLTTWHQWRQLFDHAHVVVLTRPGFTAQPSDDFLEARRTTHNQELSMQKAGKLFFQPITQLDISSTAIRQIFAERRNPEFLLPENVITYIKQHNLYETSQ